MIRGAVVTYLLVCTALWSSTARAGDFIVQQGGGGTHTTIQSAINDAAPGQTITVMPGDYVESINFLGKDIVVVSLNPADPEIQGDTVIMAPAASRVVTFAGGETQFAVLRGFTITGGSSPLGAGVYCTNGSSPTLRQNLITLNASLLHGGGIYCDNGASPQVIGNSIVNNSCEGRGAGVFAENSSIYLSGNDIRLGFTVDSSGGGVHLGVGTDGAQVVENTIAENTAVFGGGVHVENASPLIARNRIHGNLGAPRGGGLSLINSGSIVTDNVIAGNQAAIASAIDCGNGAPQIHWNTITANRTTDAAVILAYNSADLALTANIIAFHDAGLAVQVLPGATVQADFNCLFENLAGDFDAAVQAGPANIFVDPLIVGLGSLEAGPGDDGECLPGNDVDLETPLVGETDATGIADYKLDPDRERFQVDVMNFPPNTSQPIRLNDQLVGNVFISGGGVGELEYDTNDGTWPPNFPQVCECDEVTVGDLVSGNLELELVGSNCGNEVWVPGDEHLQAASPCIDAGPISYSDGAIGDMDGQFRPYGSATDIGADEYVAAGSGDYDGDGDVDLLDVSQMIVCLNLSDDFDCVAGDLDFSSVVDLADFALLPVVLTGPASAP